MRNRRLDSFPEDLARAQNTDLDHFALGERKGSVTVPAMMHPADARRRWFGVFFLIVAAGMLIWGQTILRDHLKGMAYVLYWLVCLCFTALAMVMALLDVRALRRRTRDQHRELVQSTMDELESDDEKDPRKPRS